LKSIEREQEVVSYLGSRGNVQGPEGLSEGAVPHPFKNVFAKAKEVERKKLGMILVNVHENGNLCSIASRWIRK